MAAGSSGSLLSHRAAGKATSLPEPPLLCPPGCSWLAFLSSLELPKPDGPIDVLFKVQVRKMQVNLHPNSSFWKGRLRFRWLLALPPATPATLILSFRLTGDYKILADTSGTVCGMQQAVGKHAILLSLVFDQTLPLNRLLMLLAFHCKFCPNLPFKFLRSLISSVLFHDPSSLIESLRIWS